MSFAHPGYIAVAIVCAAIFALLYRLFERRRARQTLAYSHLPFLVAAVSPPKWPRRALMALWIAAVALLVFAISGPHVRAMVPSLGGSVVLCVDTSGSMTAADGAAFTIGMTSVLPPPSAA